MALTAKQKRFVEEYLIDLNATQAAIRAGYSARCAGEIGHENLRKPQIAAEIEKAQAERSDDCGVTVEYVLTGLKREAEDRSKGSTHGARVQALIALGKHRGMFVDKGEIDVTHHTPKEIRLRAVAPGER